MEIKLAQDFKEFLKLLNENNVEYLLIGGYAVAYYGYPRATKDLDVWIPIDTSNSQRLVKALIEFGFTANDVSIELFEKPNNIVRMGVPPLMIEIINQISGVDFMCCCKHKIVAEIDGITTNMIHLDDLKKNKLASGRAKDRDDLENLPS